MASTHLLGVFLTVLTYRGPQLVYHYYDPSLAAVVEETNAADEGIEWSEDDLNEVDEHAPPQSPALSALGRSNSGHRSSSFHFSYNSVGSLKNYSETEMGPQADDAEKEDSLPYGFEEDILAEILSPPEALCNKRFSLMVENCMFVGIPVHILESGTWRQLKEQQSPLHAEDFTEHVVTAEDSPMRMFHVCFVCDPPISEASEAENRLYNNILVPLTRTLRQEQASKNYVWHEVSQMQRVAESTTHLSVKERLDALEQHSELARALKGICCAIGRMEIARVVLCNKPRAFQVPLQLELQKIPSFMSSAPPHAYLSTSNDPKKEIGHDCHECYGLLLLGDPELIVKEIDVDPKGPVAAMIRNIDPSLSLAELAKQNRIDIKQIVNLVWSLVYWRRARIIIPLNYRYIYSVSPLAATDQLYSLAKSFHHLFPVIPPLQRFLSLLSTSKPKPFIMHVPSADHRAIYMRALAWLLQNDLVVHLPTFAQILITRKIKLASMHTDEIETELAEDEIKQDDTVAGQLQKDKWLRRQSSTLKMDLNDIQESCIMDPRHATPLESRWLAQIAVSGVTRSPELAALFQRLVKYFNQKDNLEQMMLKEKISRDEMRKFLNEFQPYILTYRHW